MPGFRFVLLLVCAIAVCLTPTSAWSQAVGWGQSRNTIYSLRLDAGEGDIRSKAETSPTVITYGLTGMEFSPDGRVFALRTQWPDYKRELVTISLDDGSYELIGWLPDDRRYRDLAFDASGRLWTTTNYYGELVHLDTSDGTATTVSVGVAPLQSVASYGGALYGLVEVAPETSALVLLDPDSGRHEMIRPLNPFVLEGWGCRAQASSMDFDDGGGLWINITELHACIIIPWSVTSYRYYENPLSNEPGIDRRLADDGPAYLGALAVTGSTRGTGGVVAVPLGHGALVCLAMLLAASAILRLRIA